MLDEVSQYRLIPAFYSDFALRNSLILTSDERNSLIQMLNYPTEVKLIYRASRDGFCSYCFISKCGDISNTVTIIKTTSNSVFGGYASAPWICSGNDIYDSNAFIFSLRRFGMANNERMNVTMPDSAVYCADQNTYQNEIVFRFGSDDLVVFDMTPYPTYQFKNYNDGKSNLGSSYQLPHDLTYESNEAQTYLDGTSNFRITEIEVYKVPPFEPYSVTYLHNG